jgi:hypothetical protein
MIVSFKTYLFIITGILSLNLTNSSCSKNIVYRKPVVGLVKNTENKPLSNVHIYYDSLDVLSPRNIVSESNGQFIFPKIEIKDSQESKRKIQKLSQFIFFRKDGYKIKKYDISKFNNSDTIRLGIIQLESF